MIPMDTPDRGARMLVYLVAIALNVYFITNLVKKMRQAIIDGNFMEFKKEFLKGYLRG